MINKKVSLPNWNVKGLLYERFQNSKSLLEGLEHLEHKEICENWASLFLRIIRNAA